MGKSSYQSDTADYNDEYVGAIEDIDMDVDQFFEQFEKPRRKRSKRSRDARRLIEQYWENKELEERLDEDYFHYDE